MDRHIDSDLNPGVRFLPYTNSLSSSSSMDGGRYSSVVSKRKQTKKPEPGAPKITRPCTECGKKFWSCKALFGHMRCHPERQWRGINPPPNHRHHRSGPNSPVQRISNVKEAVMMTEDDHEVAACLLMLANGNDHHQSERGTSSQLVVRENCVSGGNCGFECSSCKRVFGSHQALGRHRASHKNVKGCFAVNKNNGTEFDQDQIREDDEIKDQNDKMLIVWGHQCTICLKVFSTGQALGGHKRCHWEKMDATSSLNRDPETLDLNFPAPIDDGLSSSYPSRLTLDLRLGL